LHIQESIEFMNIKWASILKMSLKDKVILLPYRTEQVLINHPVGVHGNWHGLSCVNLFQDSNLLTYMDYKRYIMRYLPLLYGLFIILTDRMK
jgi:hypothetical protein